MAKRKPPQSLSEQIREIIKAEIEDGYGSAYVLAEKANVDRSVLSRFIHGKRTMTLDTLDKLAGLLKLQIERRGR